MPNEDYLKVTVQKDCSEHEFNLIMREVTGEDYDTLQNHEYYSLKHSKKENTFILFAPAQKVEEYTNRLEEYSRKNLIDFQYYLTEDSFQYLISLSYYVRSGIPEFKGTITNPM